MFRNCKNCGKQILVTLPGTRDFCSQTCKKEYRRGYWAAKKREDRWGLKGVHKSGGYRSTDVHKTPSVERPLSTICKSEKEVPVTLWKCPINGLYHDWRAIGSKIYCARCKTGLPDTRKEGHREVSGPIEGKKRVSMDRAA